MKQVETLLLTDLDDTLIRTTEKIKPLPVPGDNDRIRDLSFIKNDDDVLYPDAERFLDRTEEAERPLVIYTYSKDPEFQQEKIDVFINRSEISVLITNRKDKAQEIGERYDGVRYAIGDYIAKSIVLIDDKKASFAGLSEQPQLSGIWLDRGLIEQPEELESGVTIVHSLDEIDFSE